MSYRAMICYPRCFVDATLSRVDGKPLYRVSRGDGKSREVASRSARHPVARPSTPRDGSKIVSLSSSSLLFLYPLLERFGKWPAHFPGRCAIISGACTTDSSQTVKLSPSRCILNASPARHTLRSSFCLLFLDGPLTVIDAFLTGPRLARYYEQFTRVPLFLPSCPVKN